MATLTKDEVAFLLKMRRWARDHLQDIKLEIVAKEHRLGYKPHPSPDQPGMPISKGAPVPKEVRYDDLFVTQSKLLWMRAAYQELDEMMDKLAPRQKGLLIDYYTNGLTYQQLGLKYGISEKQIRKHVERALAHMI